MGVIVLGGCCPRGGNSPGGGGVIFRGKLSLGGSFQGVIFRGVIAPGVTVLEPTSNGQWHSHDGLETNTQSSCKHCAIRPFFIDTLKMLRFNLRLHVNLVISSLFNKILFVSTYLQFLRTFLVISI